MLLRNITRTVVFILGSALMITVQAAGVIKGDAVAGEGKAVTCGACHGVDGNSAVPNFPKLAGLGEKYLLKQMKDIRDGRRPVAAMAGQVDNMTDQDLADIAAFYDAKERTSEMADEDLVALGRKVYMSGIMERKVAACSGCHSPSVLHKFHLYYSRLRLPLSLRGFHQLKICPNIFHHKLMYLQHGSPRAWLYSRWGGSQACLIHCSSLLQVLLRF